MAWICSPSASVTRILAMRVGPAAYGSGRHSTISKPSFTRSPLPSSAALGLDLPRAAAHVGEELLDPLPRLLPAVEAPPVDLDEPHELVAGVDRDEVALG